MLGLVGVRRLKAREMRGWRNLQRVRLLFRRAIAPCVVDVAANARRGERAGGGKEGWATVGMYIDSTFN